MASKEAVEAETRRFRFDRWSCPKRARLVNGLPIVCLVVMAAQKATSMGGNLIEIFSDEEVSEFVRCDRGTCHQGMLGASDRSSRLIT
jgi:hypothetical protein